MTHEHFPIIDKESKILTINTDDPIFFSDDMLAYLMKNKWWWHFIKQVCKTDGKKELKLKLNNFITNNKNDAVVTTSLNEFFYPLLLSFLSNQVDIVNVYRYNNYINIVYQEKSSFLFRSSKPRFFLNLSSIQKYTQEKNLKDVKGYGWRFSDFKYHPFLIEVFPDEN